MKIFVKLFFPAKVISFQMPLMLFTVSGVRNRAAVGLEQPYYSFPRVPTEMQFGRLPKAPRICGTRVFSSERTFPRVIAREG